jgi:hypothetical protein
MPDPRPKKFGHDGLQISCGCQTRYDDVNIPKWNLEVEPFVTH